MLLRRQVIVLNLVQTIDFSELEQRLGRLLRWRILSTYFASESPDES
jgi:hypothetical protein